jgi:hypothetical protein
MELLMPRSISKFVMVAVAIGMAVVGATSIGIVAARSSNGQVTITTTPHMKARVPKTEFHFGDHQQLKKMLLGDDRLR